MRVRRCSRRPSATASVVLKGRFRRSSAACSMRCTRKTRTRTTPVRRPTATRVTRRHRRFLSTTTVRASARRRRGRRARRNPTRSRTRRCACLSTRTLSPFSRGGVPFERPPSRRARNRNVRILSELTIDQEENLTSTKHETTLRESLTHDSETPSEISLDDLQQRIRKLRIKSTMPVAVAHGKRIKARVLGLNGEDESARSFRFLARRDGGRSNGTPLRLKRESVRGLRQAHLRVLDLVGVLRPFFLFFFLRLRVLSSSEELDDDDESPGSPSGGGPTSCGCASCACNASSNAALEIRERPFEPTLEVALGRRERPVNRTVAHRTGMHSGQARRRLSTQDAPEARPRTLTLDYAL